MFLNKQVKAGVLLYALLMFALFSLVLQFYLHRQVAENQLSMVSKQETTAYLMAQMTLDTVRQKEMDSTYPSQIADSKKARSVVRLEESFSTGKVQVVQEKGRWLLTVYLSDGSLYHYHFPKSSQKP